MGEYIERDELLTLIEDERKQGYGLCMPEELKRMYTAGLFKAKSIVEKQLTADVVEVKHGEWIKHKPDPEIMKQFHTLGIAKGMSEKSIFWTCSCCKGWGTPAHKYCSHCGAKMDLKEGAEE